MNPSTAVLLLLLWPAGIPRSNAADRPHWVDHPKGDDSVFTYRVGHATGSDPISAKQAAFARAIEVILDDLMSRAGIDPSDRTDVRNRIAVQNVEILPDCTFFTNEGANHGCWIQVSYPLVERTQLLKRLAEEKARAAERARFDRQLEATFLAARTAMSRGAFQDAETNLISVMNAFSQAKAPSFTVEEIQILLGDVHVEQKDFLPARDFYEQALHSSPNPDWRTKAESRLKSLPKPPRFWPMHKRWSGGRVALLCAIRDGGTPRAFVELAQLLAKDCVEARLASADIARELDSNSLATAFDSADFASSLTCASSRDCPVLLAILHDIDPKLRGTVQQTMGVSMPAIDSTVRFFVYSVKTSELVYTGQFKEVAGKSSEIRLAARIAGLIIERYLVPHCPAVEGR